MNEITAIFLFIWILCLLANAVNIIICVKRWLPMRKGRTPCKPFVYKNNRVILWVSVISSYIAIILFCLFFDVSVMEKAKLFAILVLLAPTQPVGLILIIEYCFLFSQNRKYSVAMSDDSGEDPSQN